MAISKLQGILAKGIPSGGRRSVQLRTLPCSLVLGSSEPIRLSMPARGGQCCRMPDYPLLYPIGPAKAVEPLLRLSRATGEEFYQRMAGEMVAFISNYQLDCPGKPWDGGMLHAIEQWSGNHWGPDKSGQVDSGMATGNSLAALEEFLARSTSCK